MFQKLLILVDFSWSYSRSKRAGQGEAFSETHCIRLHIMESYNMSQKSPHYNMEHSMGVTVGPGFERTAPASHIGPFGTTTCRPVLLVIHI